MPHIQLLGGLSSPFTRKIRILIAEMNIPFDYLPENPAGEINQIIPHNPLGKVPVIIVDGTQEIYDSRVIIEYLEWLSPSPALIPPGGMERIAVKRWEALADGICDAGVVCQLEHRRPPEKKHQVAIHRQTRKFERGVEMASKQLGDNQWCHGNAFSLADIAIGTAMEWIGLRYPDNDPRKRYANLKALHERLMQRPAFASTAPPLIREGRSNFGLF